MVLVQVPFPFVWDPADTLPVEMSTMLPELSLTLTMMISISAMTYDGTHIGTVSWGYGC